MWREENEGGWFSRCCRRVKKKMTSFVPINHPSSFRLFASKTYTRQRREKDKTILEEREGKSRSVGSGWSLSDVLSLPDGDARDH